MDAVATSHAVDATEIAIIAKALQSAADEMNLNLIRSAFSTVVREAQDCSTALLDADGNVVAQAETIPMQTAALSLSFKGAAAQLDLSGVTERHAIIMNDPYAGGQHLNDIILFSPIVVDGALIGWSGSTAHHLDIGGGAAGVNPSATDHIMEGIVIPPLLMDVERDWHGGMIERLIFANVRTAEIGLGDVNAQFAANHTGRVRLKELAERYGVAGLRRAMDAVMDYAERRMRAAIAELPDGTYRGEASIDRDVFVDEPVTVRVTLQVTGSDLGVDFTGTDAQVRSMFNCPVASAHAAVFAAVRSVIADKDMPANDGCNRPLDIHLPKGSLLNPNPPAPVRARMAAAYRAFDSVQGALAGAMREKVPAQGFNSTTGFYIGQRRSDGYRVFVDVLGGGFGAGHAYEGVDACDNILSNCRITPIEAFEQANPHLRMEATELIPDSGGAGRWRGGLGFRRRFAVLEEGTFLNLYSDHYRVAPSGAEGGGPGGLGSLVIERGGEAISLPPMAAAELQVGDVVVLSVGGGGGYGDPRERPRELVERDLADGRITVDHARAHYGYTATG
ncbi:hydantoinase B/oxoprolinase family protein [Acuticoccus sp.]|uniref:hydantoinase B/oxoprolinase family protein n=1 Tax=Acuticoccus sp. TaxID=1904378 RepID=UPI003B5179AE